MNALDKFVQRLAGALSNEPTFRRIEQKLDKLMADQDHLDSDVQSLTSDFTQVLTELKAQVAANPTAPASTLDFTKLDAFVATVHAEATADAPVPAVSPAP